MRIKRYLFLFLTLSIVISGFAGVNVSAAWVSGDNIAPAAKLSAFPVAGNQAQMKSVVDGVIGDGTGDKRYYASSNQIDAYIEFDFAEEVTIGGAKIVSGQINSSTSSPDTAVSFSIQYLDGDEWRDAAEVIGNSLMTVSVRFPKPAKSTKFRFKSKQSTSFRIREIELYQAFKMGGDMVRAPELERTRYRTAFELLANLGVIEYSGSFNPEAVVTKEEFIHYILKLSQNTSFNVKGYKSSYTDVNESKYRDEIIYAELLGYIGKDGSDKFYPKKEITYTEAAQIVLSMGGYDFFAEERGGYPTGYLYYASRVGLDSNVKPMKNDYIVLGDVLNLLYNAASMPVYEYMNSGEKTTVSTGKSALEYYQNIHKISGILYQTDSFGIPEAAPSGKVKIGNEYYNIGETDAKDYIGYSIDAWYVESGSEKTLLYLSPSGKNKVYNIEKNDIRPKSDFSTLYYYNDNGEEKSLKIAYDAYVFLNGEIGAAYTDDLSGGSGSVELIDNNSDGSIDVILINSMRYMVAASVSNGVIYDKLKGKSVDTNGAKELVVIKNGLLVTLKDIKENDVLCVNEAEDSSIITIYACDSIVKGTVSELSGGDELRVKIDGTEYKYIKEVSEDLKIGTTADFHTDKDGIIVYVDNKINVGLQYGLLLGFGGDEWKVRGKLLNTSGEIKEYTLADKVIYNDASQESAKLLGDGMLFDNTGKFYKQVVKYQLNTDGKIAKLYTGGINPPEAEPAFLEDTQSMLVRYTDAAQYYYNKPVLTAYNMGRTMVLSTDTVVFEGPDGEADDDEYSVNIGINGLTAGDWRGTACVYDLAYNGIPGALFFKKDDRPVGLDTAVNTSVIIDNFEAYDEDSDETVISLKMYTNGIEETVILSDKCKYNVAANKFLSPFGDDYSTTDLSTLGTGDVIQYATKQNKIIAVRILAKAKDLQAAKASDIDTKIQESGGTASNVIPSLETAFGSAYSGDSSVLVLKIEDSLYPYSCPTTANVYIFNADRNNVRKASINDLVYFKNSSGESKIFIRAYRKAIKDIMIVE
ncbi:MAG: discoidin domain-containing protein [Monoglobaceae bacterium]